jgi:hypothetical protein
VFEDCKGAKDIEEGEYIEWNALCQPGEVAGFLELVSDDKVSIALETETVDEILEGWATSYGASRKIGGFPLQCGRRLLLPDILDRHR